MREIIELENFSDHLQTLQPKDWDRLFALLPELEASADFGQLEGGRQLNDGSITMPYWEPSKIVDKTIHVINDLNLCPTFDWTAWHEGKSVLNDRNFDFSQLDIISLCKILTTIMRADRFNDGFLIECFRNRMMLNILKALKEKIH